MSYMASTGDEADARPSPPVLRAQRGAGHAPRRQEIRAASFIQSQYISLIWTRAASGTSRWEIGRCPSGVNRVILTVRQ